MIDPKDYLTVEQAISKIGCSRRSIYRIIQRLPEGAVVKMFNRTLIHKSMLPQFKKEYAPFGSTRRHEISVAAGHKGGTQKGVNYAKARRSRGRSSESGTPRA